MVDCADIDIIIWVDCATHDDFGFDGILLITINPCYIITYQAYKIWDYPDISYYIPMFSWVLSFCCLLVA